MSLSEDWSMEMSTHSAAACDMGVKSDRGSRQTVGDWGPRPSDLSSVDTAERGVNSDAAAAAAADAVVCAFVCVQVCVRGVSCGWQMSNLSAPPPQWDHLLDLGHLEAGPALWTHTAGSDPACWPMIHDHTTWQEVSRVNSADPSIWHSAFLFLFFFITTHAVFIPVLILNVWY